MIRFGTMVHVRVRAVACALVTVLALPGTAAAADLHATPSMFASTFSQAQDGDRILLASGNYGTWAGGNKRVTITPASGATATMQVNFTTGDAGFTLDGLSGMGGSITNGARDITIRNSTFTSHLTFDGLANSNILLDHNTHNDINSPSGDPNARLGFYWSSSTPSGVTIENSLLRGGDSDGVHTGVAVNVIDNEFVDICDKGGNHTDNIQFEGAVGGRIAGNYIHASASCTTQGITSYDGGTNGVTIEDNVIDVRRTWGIEFYADKSSIIRHNTVRYYGPGCYGSQPCGMIALDHKSGDPAGVGTQVYDNVATVTLDDGSTAARNDHNVGGQNVQYVGPTTTWAGFALAHGSPGEGAASDGLDVGIRAGASSPPPDTTPPDTTITSSPVVLPVDTPSVPSAPVAPTVTLTAPAANSTVGRSVRFTAEATSSSAIKRVEFWVDSRRVATDRRAPYSSRVQLTGLSSGTHTVTARAFDSAGQAASSAELVRVSRNRTATRTHAMNIAARPAVIATAAAGGDATRLAGQAPKQRMLRVSLTRCDDSSGAVADSMRLRADAEGRVDGTRSRAGLCVLRLAFLS